MPKGATEYDAAHLVQHMELTTNDAGLLLIRHRNYRGVHRIGYTMARRFSAELKLDQFYS